MPQVLTANRLKIGEVVYWNKDGWVPRFDQAQILSDAEGVWRCRTTFNCTEACPRGIQVTKAIQEVKRALMFRRI